MITVSQFSYLLSHIVLFFWILGLLSYVALKNRSTGSSQLGFIVYEYIMKYKCLPIWKQTMSHDLDTKVMMITTLSWMTKSGVVKTATMTTYAQ